MLETICARARARPMRAFYFFLEREAAGFTVQIKSGVAPSFAQKSTAVPELIQLHGAQDPADYFRFRAGKQVVFARFRT